MTIDPSAPPAQAPAKPPTALWKKVVPWAITVLCFAYLYTRIAGAAAEGQSVASYLAGVFASVSWTRWLALMLPYSLFYLFVDTLALWRVVNWFNARVAYRDLLPVRASTYIISLVNEQVGKGAMAYYLNKREGVPGWQLGSSMLFIMFCEFYYLLAWATIGIALLWSALPEGLEVFRAIPVVAGVAAAFFVAWILFFGSPRLSSGVRDRHIFHAFREGRAYQYGTIMLIRSPAIIAAAFVYGQVAGLFGVEVSFGEMLCYAPIAFFGTFVPGPFRPVAVSFWPTVFADQAGEMAAFGFVQHNSFVLFNAAIGLLFLRRANRELFEEEEAGSAATATAGD